MEASSLSKVLRHLRGGQMPSTMSGPIVEPLTRAALDPRLLSRLLRQGEMILMAAGTGICALDGDGIIIFVNPAAAHMLGWESEALLGRGHHEVFHAVLPNGL